jgi:hypothetical protein
LAPSQLLAAFAVVQLVAHDPPAMHRKPVPHAAVDGPQTPAALHVPAATNCWCRSDGHAVTVAVQLERCSHPAAPSQLPLSPQAPAAAAGQVTGLVARGGLPPAMLEQTPVLPDNLQLWHPPAQVLSQQIPSAEQTRPVPQSLFATHDSPAASLSPQRLLVFKQVSWFVQSASEVQVLRQVGLLALQT